MKKITLALALIFSINLLFSNPVDTITAKRVAENFYKQNNVIGVKNGTPLRLNKMKKEFQNVTASTDFEHFYIFNAKDGNGFVIVSADDQAVPILGYSDKGIFSTDNIPSNVKAWLDGYDREMESFLSQSSTIDSAVAIQWSALKSNKCLPVRNIQNVAPLIQTTWNQDLPYNVLCPYDAPTQSYTVTGCVATAMAQVMKYWEYPNVGTGSNSYIDPNYGIQSANFESLLYWNEMPMALTQNSSVMQILSVAKLMRFCGVSTNMQYGTSSVGGSFTNMGYAAMALLNNFNYSQNLDYIERDNMSYVSWINHLKSELDNGRPILYQGTDNQGVGHAFVCDGYHQSNEFHFNWGWGGLYDGYYVTSALNPGTGGAGSGSGVFSYNQLCLINIEPTIPTTHPNYDLEMYAPLTTIATTFAFGDNVQVNYSVANFGTAAFNGYLIIIIEDDTSNVMQKCVPMSIQSGYYNSGTISLPGGLPLSNGNYYGYLFSATDTNDLNTFQLIRDNNINTNLAQFTVSEQLQDQYEINNTVTSAYLLATVNTNNATIVANATFHVTTDNDYYKINLPSGYSYTINAYLQDSYNNSNYTADAKFATSTDGSTWSSNYGNSMPALTISDGGTLYFRVLPYTSNEIGTYSLHIEVTRTTVIEPDMYEPNNTASAAYLLGTISNNSTTMDVSANFHITTDNDYYKINLPSGYSYTINANILNSYNNSNYTADAKFATSTDGSTWSSNYGNSMSALTMSNGGTLYFRVLPYTNNEMGTYSLHIDISRQGGIEPDVYEPNNSSAAAYLLETVNGSSVTINAEANFHVTNDADYYKIIMLPGYSYAVDARLYDSNNDGTYTVDAKFSVSQDGNNWSEYYGVYAPTMMYSNGGRVYYHVIPNQSGTIGTYRLNVEITASNEIEEYGEIPVLLYPNPASEYLYVTISESMTITNLYVYNMEGQLIKTVKGKVSSINIAELSKGMYFIRIHTDKGFVVRKFVKK